VVLPLPGRNVALPSNGIGAFMRDVAAAEGVPLDTPLHGVTEFCMASAGGDYRRLLCRPRDLRFHFARHAAMDDELIAADAAALPQPPPRGIAGRDTRGGRGGRGGRGRGAPADASADVEMAAETEAGAEAALPPPPPRALLITDASQVESGSTRVVHEGGQQLSLVLSFSLPSSAYATMLTRELLKRSSATAAHKVVSKEQNASTRAEAEAALAAAARATEPAAAEAMA